MSQPSGYGYSTNSEWYDGDFDTREDAIEAGNRAAIELDRPYFSTGKLSPVDGSTCFSVDDVLENMNCQAQDYAGDAAEDWLMHVSEKDRDELRDMILAWIGRVDPPSFSAIENVETHKVVK